MPLKTVKSQKIEGSLHFPSPLLHKLLSKAVVEAGIKTNGITSRNEASWNSIESATPFGTMPQ